MLNNDVLDVAIGLVFIYLLYSLLATTIKELIATIFSYRGRMLERGLEQMLDGKNYSYYWWDKLYNFLKVFFKKSSIAKQEDNKAAITQSKSVPAIDDGYLTVSEKIARYNQRAVECCKSPDITFLNNSTLCKKLSMFTAQVTSHAIYKRSSENSILSKKPAYLPSDAFSSILINIFSPNSNIPVLLKDIANKINERANDPNDPLNADTARILNIYIAQANGDLQRFKLLIEGWYDDTMNRVSGWYKRQAFKILLIIGFLLAMLFNVNTIAIVKKLSSDKNVREAMVKNASEYVKVHQNEFTTTLKPGGDNTPKTNATKDTATQKAIARLNAVKDSIVKIAKDANNTAQKKQIDSINNLINTAVKTKIVNDSVTKARADSNIFAATKANLKSIKSLYNESIAEQNTTLGLGWGDYGYKTDSTKWAKDSVQLKKDSADKKKYTTNSGPVKAYWSGRYWLAHVTWFFKHLTMAPTVIADAMPSKPQPRHFGGKAYYIISKTLIPENLIGFLLTALAISLGAPFWFDLLNKFVNLRAAGSKPDDKDSGASKTDTLNKKPAPNSFA